MAGRVPALVLPVGTRGRVTEKVTEKWKPAWRITRKGRRARWLAAQTLQLEAQVQILGLPPGDYPTLDKLVKLFISLSSSVKRVYTVISLIQLGELIYLNA